MVHGGGSCSGGGFSGGGFSGGTYISTNNYYGNSRGNEDCAKCILCMCRGVAICVCCKGQSHFNTIKIFWAWLVVLFLITGLSVGLGRFGPTDIPISPSDMMIMKRGIDPNFCDSVDVRSIIPVSTYLLSDTPTIAPNRIKYTFNKTAYINDDQYEYWGFYLIAGSEITINSCADSYGDLYIVKGNHQFGKWKEDNYAYENNKKHQSIGGCTYPFYTRSVVSYRATETDEYFFVFANHGYTTLGVQVSFQLDRAVYDVTNETRLCANVNFCSVDFSNGNHGDTIVVYVPPYDAFDSYVTTACSPLIYVYILIFLVLPLTIGSIFTTIVLHRKRRADDTPGRSLTGGENRAFSTNTSPPPYQTMRSEPVRDMKMTPPTYGFQDDGMAVKPPTYEEAVARTGDLNK